MRPPKWRGRNLTRQPPEGENPLTLFMPVNIPAMLPKDVQTATTEGVPGYATRNM